MPSQRGTARERCYTKPWDREAAQYKRDHPLCLGCEAMTARVVDHIEPRQHELATPRMVAAWIGYLRFNIKPSSIAERAAMGDALKAFAAEMRRITPLMETILRAAAAERELGGPHLVRSARILERRGFLKMTKKPLGWWSLELTPAGRMVLCLADV